MRTAIFLGYLTLLSRQRDLRRLFQYHGAEHKIISTYEAGLRADARQRAGASRACTRAAARASCSWSMIVAIFVFAPGRPAGLVRACCSRA